MLNRTLAFAAVLAVVAAAPAFGNHCPKDMAEIDQYLATHMNVPADKLAEVKKLRMEGETLHKAGDHANSVAKLDQAKKMLGMGM